MGPGAAQPLKQQKPTEGKCHPGSSSSSRVTWEECEEEEEERNLEKGGEDVKKLRGAPELDGAQPGIERDT
ncbi:hypothetical protein EYF80_011275 [Liparis tanakae]|uniref:Uncharacterized protein n=1 Tax=Liparis tanakae TaxID=230148 RepID=A0A4Z2IMQ3_9TELE|nr:hypothetical protein EYF80_011275 [Liparis tanakae]